MPFETVAFDIETTGFDPDDRVTVVGFAMPLGVRILLNAASGDPPADLEARLADRADTVVDLSAHADEAELLAACSAFTRPRFGDQNYKLAAFNAETWNGGFDLPFLRTRLQHHDVAWPFPDAPFVDIYEVFASQWNTPTDSLASTYESLLGSDLGRLDPFADSEEAVKAWERGAFEALCRHNLADVLRTAKLTALAEAYCSKADFGMKSLTPVANAGDRSLGTHDATTPTSER